MAGDLRTVQVLLIARATIFALPFVEPDQVSSDTMKYVMPVVGVTPGTHLIAMRPLSRLLLRRSALAVR
jgi:hypothetical protein